MCVFHKIHLLKAISVSLQRRNDITRKSLLANCLILFVGFESTKNEEITNFKLCLFSLFPQPVPVQCPLLCDASWLRCWVECGGGRRQVSSGRGWQLLPEWRRGWAVGSWFWPSPSAPSLSCCWSLCCWCCVPAARGEHHVIHTHTHTHI